MTRIGIMEGRLLPPVDSTIYHFPRDNWAKEFELAAQAGLDCIEWIYDLYGADVNPLSTNDGIKQIKLLSRQHNIQVLSLCANYFIDMPLIRTTISEQEKRLEKLFWLFRRCQLIGIIRLILPFLDASRIDTDAELDQVVDVLKQTSLVADETGTEILLETSLPPDRFAELLDKLSPQIIKVNYDTGNSASLGYDPRDEFAAYGRQIGSVHIKDRMRLGGTVPLGTGNVDFHMIAGCLNEVGYTGDFVLEAARGKRGNELAWAIQNRNFIMKYFYSG